MEFKNLAEVTQLDEVPEGASVLAATAEGEVVRVPGDGLGGGGGGALIVGVDGESLDTPFADILAALQAGQSVEVHGQMGGSTTEVFRVCSYSSASISFINMLAQTIAQTSGVYVMQLVLNSDDSVELIEGFALLEQ